MPEGDVLDSLATRFNTSRRTVFIVLALGVGLIVFWFVRKHSANNGTVGPTGVSGQPVTNGPWASGSANIDANPAPTSPQGGADLPVPTPTPTSPAPVPAVPGSSSTTPTGGAAVFVSPAKWPARTSTLSGIASANAVSLATIESFPENQYIPRRSSWDLIYTTDRIRIR